MRRDGGETSIRLAGIILLILNLAHVPLPVADFHALGHLHGEGQLCALHNHLLRWHAPGGDSSRPVLHFHWAFLVPPRPDAENKTPAVHADSPDPFDIESSDDDPKPTLETAVRTQVAKSLPPLVVALLPAIEPGIVRQPAKGCSLSASRNFNSTFPPRSSLSSRLERWRC
jgi:hypothetical protein